MKKGKFRFVFIQSTFNMENLKFWVFRKGKILPVALVEVSKAKVKVNCFDEEKKEIHEIKESFQQFSGCRL